MSAPDERSKLAVAVAEIVVRDGATGIRCLRCGRTSWNPTDVREHYCGHCHAYLTEWRPPE